MVRTLSWDSKFFQKKIGEIRFDRRKCHQLQGVVQNAQKKGFQYLICKIRNHETSAVKTLESLNFYLSDIGITWKLDIQKDPRMIHQPAASEKTIRIAGVKDIPLLQKMITSMFVTSRFYKDPFFTRSEANKLYQKWIENSVLGKAADIVFFIPDTGFACCKKIQRKGDIRLIGVKKQLRGKGIGTVLLREALQWFCKNKIYIITARTQLKNVPALNFYRKAGFEVAEYDIIFSKIL